MSGLAGYPQIPHASARYEIFKAKSERLCWRRPNPCRENSSFPSTAHFALNTSSIAPESAQMNAQDLTDRLMVAIEEQDILYVLHWLREMREENCLDIAINNKRESIVTLGDLLEVELIIQARD